MDPIGIWTIGWGRAIALLRDIGSSTSLSLDQRTFSLARTKMAWWTLIIVGSYTYEWIASGTMPPLSAQALALMGIYSVLTVGSRSVDLARETHFPPSVPLFFRDLVSDESGVAIHRLQMLVFTVIVGLMFVHQVLTTASKPALEPYTLSIIGISETARLDESTDWTHVLSLGEQQRLAFGRLLLSRPAAAFLDEATSSMDEGMEDAMYQLVRARLPSMTLVSVGHRSTLLVHHRFQLELDGEGRWKVGDCGPSALRSDQISASEILQTEDYSSNDR
ncbi:hypothetical protein [Caballeronia sp. Sq4a]|uniref:hypothetical protein n=1 Tax=Caballeronia sp. Sq4a TaxID=2878152 RepID=UPI0020C10FAC|nr:hypothetical protein [Caballeronia sp. Sq4a]